MPTKLRFLTLLGAAAFVRGSLFPYTRKFTNGTTPADEIDSEIPDLFTQWLVASIQNHQVADPTGHLRSAFVDNPHKLNQVRSLDDLQSLLASNAKRPGQLPPTVWDDIPQERIANMSTVEKARTLFSHLNFGLAPECIRDQDTFWYRTADGSCNWLKRGEPQLGSTFQPRSRDFNQHTYADGISKPREGPNPRELSNAFFRRKERLHYEHTPLMLGLVEWLMHDVSFSEDALGSRSPADGDGPPGTEEFIDVPIPAGDDAFDPEGHGNRTFRVWRTKPAAGTGTSKENPREHENGSTAWLDASALYGSTKEVGDALRTFKDGKLKAQKGKDGRDYLPFNDGPNPLPMRTRPGINVTSLFMGGDPRTNEDWIMISVHTLLLREHNRLCDIARAMYPDWDDERLYQTMRLVIGSKIALIGNSYQMAYWSDSMPWPRDDGFPLYRAMYGANALEINPAHVYPWPLVTRSDRPMITSAEMSIVYRFHEFIINSFPLKDEHNATIEELTIFSTGFDSKRFLDKGADVVLRGMLATDIPNFKSGVDETFRSAGRYRGAPLDLVVWSIVHEREQGLPTFNQYFRGYASMEPKPSLPVKIRKTFEDFSSDPQAVAQLKRLYRTPDDVDFVVGVQLEEEMFPGTTMPISALIPSLFSLFGVGNSDRFSPGFAVMRCFLVDKPWNCHPSNAIEDLIWKPNPSAQFPNARWLDSFWMKELDFQAHGTNLLFRLITENTGALCVQKNPLFPFDPATNPILCEPPASSSLPIPPGDLWHWLVLLLPHNVIKALLGPFIPWAQIVSGLHLSWRTFFTVLAGIAATVVAIDFLIRIRPHTPPTNWGSLIAGVGQQLQKDPVGFLLSQQAHYGKGNTFGLRLFGTMVYYIAGSPTDLDAMKYDERRASFHATSDDAQLGSVVGRKNFAEELHASLIREHLEDKRDESMPTLAVSTTEAVRAWLDKNPLEGANVATLTDKLLDLMAHVMSRTVSGPQAYDDPTLIAAYKGLNAASVTVFGVSVLLPHWVSVPFSTVMTLPHWIKIKRVLKPVVKARRAQVAKNSKVADAPVDDMLTIFVRGTDSDDRVAELVGGIVIGGLINVASALNNALYDAVAARVPLARPTEFGTFWKSPNPLKAAVFESLRLSACIFGPVRKIIVRGFKLASDESLHLPKNSALAASAYLVHYDEDVYRRAREYVPTRFGSTDPDMGSAKYLTFGLPAHTCPGRFFAVQAVAIALNELLLRYDMQPANAGAGGEGYDYKVGDVVMVRKPFALNIKRK